MTLDVTAIITWMETNAPQEHLLEAAQPEIGKAGIIPLFEDDGTTYILLIKPRGKKKHLGAPPWQLVKGTRMYRSKRGWEDIKKGDAIAPEALEPLICSALREGIEEAGLRLDNIAAIGPLGVFDYRSASNDKKKSMQLYALLMKHKEDFDWPKNDHPVTEDMQWFDIHTLPDDTRGDAREIIQKIRDQL